MMLMIGSITDQPRNPSTPLSRSAVLILASSAIVRNTLAGDMNCQSPLDLPNPVAREQTRWPTSRPQAVRQNETCWAGGRLCEPNDLGYAYGLSPTYPSNALTARHARPFQSLRCPIRLPG